MLQSQGQNQNWPTSGQIGYITLAVWGSATLQSGGQISSGPQGGALYQVFYLVERTDFLVSFLLSRKKNYFFYQVTYLLKKKLSLLSKLQGGCSRPGPDPKGGGGVEEEELPAIGAGPVPANSRDRVPTPRVSTTRIGMQLPDQLCHVHPGRGANWTGVSLEINAPAEPGYLGDRPDPGLEPKSSGRMEAPAHHGAAKVTGVTRRPQPIACISFRGPVVAKHSCALQDEQTGHGRLLCLL